MNVQTPSAPATSPTSASSSLERKDKRSAADVSVLEESKRRLYEQQKRDPSPLSIATYAEFLHRFTDEQERAASFFVSGKWKVTGDRFHFFVSFVCPVIPSFISPSFIPFISSVNTFLSYFPLSSPFMSFPFFSFLILLAVIFPSFLTPVAPLLPRRSAPARTSPTSS